MDILFVESSRIFLQRCKSFKNYLLFPSHNFWANNFNSRSIPWWLPCMIDEWTSQHFRIIKRKESNTHFLHFKGLKQPKWCVYFDASMFWDRLNQTKHFSLLLEVTYEENNVSSALKIKNVQKFNNKHTFDAFFKILTPQATWIRLYQRQHPK